MRLALALAALALCAACATGHDVPLNQDDSLRMMDVTVSQEPLRVRSIPEIMPPSDKSLEIVTHR